MRDRKPRSTRRPLPTTPGLLAYVNRVQELIDARGTNYYDLARLTNYTRAHVKSVCEGQALSIPGVKALDAALNADGELIRLRERAVAERNAERYGYAPPVDGSVDGSLTNGQESHGTRVSSSVGAGDSPESPRDPREVIPANRRDLLALLGTGATAGVVPLTPVDRLVMLEQYANGDGIVSMIDAQLAGCVQAYRTLPPATLLGQLDTVQSLIDHVSARVRLGPADQTHLWRTATVTAGLRGWLHNNAGETVAARVSLAEAHKRAELIDDENLIAWTRYMQAITEDYAGNPHGAQHYADDGLRHARTGPQRALILSDVVAPVRARMGDPRGVESAVSEARDIVHTLPPSKQGPVNRTIVDNASTYNPTSGAIGSALSYALLGRPDKVRQAWADVSPDVEAQGTYHRSYILLDEALASSRSTWRDPERIASLATQGLALATPYQSAHVGQRADAIVAAVQPMKDHRVIGELIDHHREWRSRQGSLSV